jgi:DNA (cytosine-5)-methyltransferase 1
MRYASLCSGIEAATVAWKPLGWSCAWLSEIDRFPCAVLKHHYPDTPNLGDMTKINKEAIKEHGAIDVLIGGTPCQSFSVAGLRKGLADPRGNLALDFLRIVDEARPEWVVWENVPGVLSSGEGRDFGAFLGALGELGYGWAYRVLDAQYFGVAQRRRRVFVVGHLGDWRRASAVLFERGSLSGHPAPSREAGSGVADLTARGVGTCGADDNQAQAGHLIEVPKISPALKSRDYKGPSSDGDGDGAPLIPVAFDTKGTYPQPGEVSPTLRSMSHNGSHANAGGQVGVAYSLRGEGFDASEDGTGRGTPIVPVAFNHDQSSKTRSMGEREEQTPTLRSGSGPPAVAYRTSGNCGVMEQGDRTAALNTNTDPNQNIVGMGMAVRRLTPRESERLQGFPDNYTLIPYRNKPVDQCPDGPRYKAIGNSMATTVIRWLGERIEQVMNCI